MSTNYWYGFSKPSTHTAARTSFALLLLRVAANVVLSRNAGMTGGLCPHSISSGALVNLWSRASRPSVRWIQLVSRACHAPGAARHVPGPPTRRGDQLAARLGKRGG